MPRMYIEMTEAEFFALDLIAVDRREWVDNLVTERARLAVVDLRSTPEWVKAAIAAGSTDDETILLKGKELGLFKTAKVRHEEFMANVEAEIAARHGTVAAE